MNVNYLRISVTDRCNLRCAYCNPSGECDFIPHEEILTFEEIERIVRLLADCGIRKVRLTGGEPLVRKGIAQLVRRLAGVSGIEEISLTTNGVLLAPMAAELKAAGAKRVNVSIDSIERAGYERITGFDRLSAVLEGIHKAIEVGLRPVRMNCVIVKGFNDSAEQITALAKMSVGLPVAVRFIEYCPTEARHTLAGDYVCNKEVRRIIERQLGPLSLVAADDMDGPAVHFRTANSAGMIGFISGRSSLFCGTCNRLRLTSDGKIKPCLYAAFHYDLKALLRGGASDEELRSLLKTAIRQKSRHTRLSASAGQAKEFSMQSIGG
jgi:GTP 3',8-cyclase